MSQLVPPKPRVTGTKRVFVLVASQFNAKYVQGLVTHCTDELRKLSPASRSLCTESRALLKFQSSPAKWHWQGNVDAIVALGVILQGETAHAQHLGQVVTQALQQISLEHGVPVIHAVLSLKNREQARKRCLEDEINRGTEAARAAIEMADLLAKLRK